MSHSTLGKAVFLDRDGVLNEDHGYVHRVSDLKIFPGVADALAELQKSGFLLIVITNQSGVARGYYQFEDVMAFNAALRASIAEQSGAEIDDFYVCPHHPNGIVADYAVSCECRKPGIRSLLQAKEKHRIDFSRSFLIGDSDSDMACAQRAGVKGLQVLPDRAAPHEYAFASMPSLMETLPYILGS